MRSTYVGYDKAQAKTLLEAVKNEGSDAFLQDSTNQGPNGSEWMGFELVYCEHGDGPVTAALVRGHLVDALKIA